ncbi:MAG: hypothetical protein LQ337_001423 [Flavoplaca oasis]|nr:MAG: hypothetical protein LQ337_001423 [Flavoplaca oasis]
MPTQTPLLQQVRTKIATLPRNIRSSRPRSKPTENRSRQAARIHPCTLPRLSPPYLKTRRIDVPDDGGWHCWDIREAGGSICSGDIGSAVLEFNPEGRGRAAASNTLCVLVNVMVEQGRHQKSLRPDNFEVGSWSCALFTCNTVGPVDVAKHNRKMLVLPSLDNPRQQRRRSSYEGRALLQEIQETWNANLDQPQEDT